MVLKSELDAFRLLQTLSSAIPNSNRTGHMQEAILDDGVQVLGADWKRERELALEFSVHSLTVTLTRTLELPAKRGSSS